MKRLTVLTALTLVLPSAAAPRLTLSAPRRQLLFPSQPPRIVARCDAACDLRSMAIHPVSGRSEPSSRTSPTGRPRPVNVGASRPGRIVVLVHASTPGGGRVAVRRVRIRVEHRRALPLRRPLAVKARRDGDEIVVRWRTAAPARRQFFLVAGQSRDDRIEVGLPGSLRFLTAAAVTASWCACVRPPRCASPGSRWWRGAWTRTPSATSS